MEVEVGIEVGVDATHRADLDYIVDRHLRAEREGDVETILDAVTDDIEYEVFGAPDNPVSGRNGLRTRALERFANQMTERHIPLRRLYGDGYVVDEMIWEGRITGRLGPYVGAGRRVSHRVLHVFELRDGHISRMSVYLDYAAVMRQLA